MPCSPRERASRAAQPRVTRSGVAWQVAALALAAAILAGTTPAGAQDGRLVAFGDSLSDNGNLYLLSGGTQPPYPSRRYSSGLSYAEILAGPMLNYPLVTPANVNAGNVNYAVGGSRTSGPRTPGPTTAEQIALFGGTGGRFGANDVASLWAGANNLFQGIPVAAANPATAVATITPVATGAAADIGAQVGALATLGARTILVPNLPNFSSLPQFTTGPGAAANALAGAASGTFNAALSSTLGTVQATLPSTNIILVDTAALFDAARANPAAFGFSNVTAACVRTPACLAAPLATQNTYLFWDDVHPTEGGYRAIAAAARAYLDAPLRGAAVATALGETSLNNRRARGLDVLSDLDRENGAVLSTPARLTADLPSGPVTVPALVSFGGWSYFVEGTGDTLRADLRVPAGLAGTATRDASFDSVTGGVRFGGVRVLDANWAIAAAGSIQGGRLEIDGARFSTDVLSLGADLAARWRSGPYFVKGALGVSFDQFTDAETVLGVGNLVTDAKIRSVTGGAALEAGLDWRVGAVTLTPLARLTYLRSHFEGYAESGVIAALNVAGREVDALSAGAEIKASLRLTDGVGAYALLGYEDHLAASGGRFRSSFVGGTGFVTAASLRDPLGAGVQFGAGLEAAIGGWTARIAYRGAVGEDDSVRHSARLGIGARF